MIYHIVLLFLIEGEHDQFHLEGLMESPSADDNGDCFSPLLLNATSVKIELYYNKAVNYTLVVTFVSLKKMNILKSSISIVFFNYSVSSLMYIYQVSILQVLLLIRQMEHSSTQSVRLELFFVEF